MWQEKSEHVLTFENIKLDEIGRKIKVIDWKIEMVLIVEFAKTFVT